MPQLNPTPWLFILITTWIITLSLLKLMAALQIPTYPDKITLTHQLTSWTWL